MDTIFIECFANLTDPRVERTKKHLLIDIIGLAICGILSGAETWEEIEDFSIEHEEWFRKFLSLPNGIPSEDTFSRVFSALDPQTFQSCCMDWLKRIMNLISEDVIAIDGKSLRGSKRINACKKALHIVNAWSCANKVCLGQLKIADKSNEISAVPELLKLLYIKGAIVTLDAMGAQEETVKQICEAGADYVITLKGNQGSLHETVKDSFAMNDAGNKAVSACRVDDGIIASHGRIEQRFIEVMGTEKLRKLIDDRWKNLKSIARITYVRTEATGEIITEKRYFITSILPHEASKILSAARQHWQIESALHWSLDVTFNEDDCRIRNENAAVNFSWLRKFALGLLKNESSFKASIRRKQRKVCTNIDYLAQIMGKI